MPENKKTLPNLARDYRNRRIGDSLNELHLTEGRGTGFPIIYNSMKQNGSPEPVFETDEQCTCFLTVLPARMNKSDQAGNQVNELIFKDIKSLNTFLNSKSNQAGDQAQNMIKKALNEEAIKILNGLIHEKTRNEIINFIGLSNQTKNRKKYLDPLIEYGWVEKLYPEKTTSPNQKYRLTSLGVKLVQLLNTKK